MDDATKTAGEPPDELALLEKLAKEPGGDADPFTTRYGPTPECLTSNDVVRMFDLGAESHAAGHLSACTACRGRVERYMAATQPVRVPQRSRGLWSRISQWAPAPAPALRPALLHVARMAAIGAQGQLAGPLRVDFLSADASRFKGMQCWVSGSIEGAGGVVQVDPQGLPYFEIRQANVAGKVRDSLRRHARAIEKLEVRVGPSEGKPRYVGRSNVAFTRVAGIKDDPTA